MRATVMYGAGDVRVENVPDASLVEPTDALLRVTRACICGGDLWPYNQMQPNETGQRMGHEFIGVVDAIGADVRTVKTGDVVVAPDAWSDGTCVFCLEGLHTSCLHGGWWARDGIDGGQGEAVRVPQADGTLVILISTATTAIASASIAPCQRSASSRPGGLSPRDLKRGLVVGGGDCRHVAARD